MFAIPAALTWRVEAEAWPYIAASAVLELAYFALLAAVYTRADLCFAYPIARGSAPVLVLLISVIALGAPIGLALPSPGVLAVTAGVLLVRGVGARRRRTRPRSRSRSASAPASRATRSSTTTASATPARCRTSSWSCSLCAIPYAAAVAGHARPRGLKAAANRRSAAAGVGMVDAYLLVLEALERADAAPVAALRETSVVMATVGAALAGRERVPAARVAGAVLVVAGVAALALGG